MKNRQTEEVLMQDPVNEDEAVEDWFQAHKELYDKPADRPRPKKIKRRKKKRRSKKAKPPIRVSNNMRKCRGCGHEAPEELFRKKRCLACQVAYFLEAL